MLNKAVQKQLSKPLVARQTTAAFSNLNMANEESKHRQLLPLYDLEPRTENNWVAPNATLGK